MTNQLKTEIEKINKEIEDILKSIPESRIATCVPLVFKKGKKQGLIQGAKMMIEDEIKDWEELLWILKDTVHKRVEDIINRKLTDLKELNNWLEKA